jgi:uncharacterized membrane protein (DUF373 family)
MRRTQRRAGEAGVRHVDARENGALHGKNGLAHAQRRGVHRPRPPPGFQEPDQEREGMSMGVKEAEAAIETFDSAATRLFRRMADWTVKVLVPVAIVVLMMAVARVFLDLWRAWQAPSIAQGFDLLVTDILSAFVVIELLKSIVEYFEAHRLKIVHILDAAVVFLLREAMIGLFQHKLAAPDVAAMAALLAVVGAFRVAAARLSPEEGTSR